MQGDKTGSKEDKNVERRRKNENRRGGVTLNISYANDDDYVIKSLLNEEVINENNG